MTRTRFFLMGFGTPVVDLVADQGEATQAFVAQLIESGVGVLDQKNYPDDATFERIVREAAGAGVTFSHYGGGTTANKLYAAQDVLSHGRAHSAAGLICTLGQDADSAQVRLKLAEKHIACVPEQVGADPHSDHTLARSLIFQHSDGARSQKLTFTNYGDVREAMTARCVQRGFAALDGAMAHAAGGWLFSSVL